MLSVGRSLRHVNHVARTLQTAQLASTSRSASWFPNFKWPDVAERMRLKEREKKDDEPVDLAKREIDEGTASESLFDAPPPPENEAEEADLGYGTAPRMPMAGETARKYKHYTKHKFSTANFKISHRKLNDLGRQIADKPIDYAILQMQFSQKRASRRIKNMLVMAKQHAVHFKNMDSSKLIVSESWVSKGPHALKRMEPRGRSHYGIRVHPDSKMSVVLKEGKTYDEKKEKKRQKQLKAIRSAGIVREDVPLRNPSSMWAW